MQDHVESLTTWRSSLANVLLPRTPHPPQRNRRTSGVVVGNPILVSQSATSLLNVAGLT